MNTLNIDTVSLAFETRTPDVIVQALPTPEYRTKAESEKYVGQLRNMRVQVIKTGLVWSAYLTGSLAKYYTGSNAAALTRQQTADAIDSLSEQLHHDVGNAWVRGRLDVGANIIVDHSPERYSNLMLSAPRMKRFLLDDSAYFKNGQRVIATYNKITELKKENITIPVPYQGRYVLRHELRDNNKLSHKIFGGKLTARQLTSEKVFRTLVDNWQAGYYSIEKMTEGIVADYDGPKAHDDYLIRFALKTLGPDHVIREVNSAFRENKITKQHRDRIVRSAKKRLSHKGDCSTGDLIHELDNKINETAKQYR
jgi:hypothetical protein